MRQHLLGKKDTEEVNWRLDSESICDKASEWLQRKGYLGRGSSSLEGDKFVWRLADQGE